MSTITIAEAQAKLAEVIHKLTPGEELLITENNRPVAKLTGAGAAVSQRPGPGLCKGMLTIVADDEDHLKDFAEYMP